MSSIPRMILGLVLGIACGLGGLAALPAAAQVTVGDLPGCPVSDVPLPPGAVIACGEPGVLPSLPGLAGAPTVLPPNSPPVEAPTAPTELPCESGLAAIHKCPHTSSPVFQ
jgi:hypothetical protein